MVARFARWIFIQVTATLLIFWKITIFLCKNKTIFFKTRHCVTKMSISPNKCYIIKTQKWIFDLSLPYFFSTSWPHHPDTWKPHHVRANFHFLKTTPRIPFLYFLAASITADTILYNIKNNYGRLERNLMF